jgi:hypothetical protein
MPEPHLRAADADRSAVADVLGTHMSAGRLSVDEYDERLTRAYAARTYGELDELTADLPPAAPAASARGTSPFSGEGTSSGARPSRPASRSTSGPAWGHPWGHLWGPGVCGSWVSGPGRAVWGQWLTTAVIVTTIWLVSSLGSGDWIYPWPIWVVGPWGVVLLAQTMSGARLGPGAASGAITETHGPPEHAPR